MKFLKCSALILSTRPLGERDRVISILSDRYGRMRIIAKGVRTIRSRRNYHIDLFNHVDLEIQETSRALYLREISTKTRFPKLVINSDRFASACIISSFISRALPLDTPQHELFSLTLKIFTALENSDNPRELLLTYFLKATRIMGFLPNIIAQKNMRRELFETLDGIDPQFTLTARRTFGIFSN